MELKATIVQVTPFAQNCTILWCTKTLKAAIVDPGGDQERIEAALTEAGVVPEKILVTHAHVDHAGAVAGLAEKLNIPIEGPHKEDQFWIDQLEPMGAEYGFTGVQAFTPDRWLDDGDTVTVGEVEFSVFHCPGHTPGHVVFHQAGAKLALVGDVLFQGSIGRTDFPRGNFDDLIQSITQKLWPLGDDTTFISGHGALSTFGDERKNNPYVGDRALG